MEQKIYEILKERFGIEDTINSDTDLVNQLGFESISLVELASVLSKETGVKVTHSQRIVLRNMYPPGCRVELEDMEADPYVKLSPGDLGTVQFVDDAGQIHVSWDCGHSLAMVFGVDHCKCVMREERLQEILQRIQAMPFESLEKMELYIMEKLSGVFPKISFQKKEGQEVFVDMGVAAFMKKGLGVAIQYETDSQQHIFIKKMEMQGQELERKNPFPVQKKR